MTTNIIRKTLARAARKVITPVVPARLRLPFKYRVNRLGGWYENELRYLGRIPSARRDVALDVGANEGLFAYSLSGLFQKVYAFEINTDLTADLTRYRAGNVEIVPVGLSSAEGAATLYIPVLNGIPLTGWASLAPGNCPDTNVHQEKPVLVRPLDALDLPAVSFMKIDVEGHELAVLEGGNRTITRDRPTVLIEVKDQNLDRVSAYFADRGYRRTKLDEFVPVPPSPENYIFIPNGA
jgi:FkbM family methyltransferase